MSNDPYVSEKPHVYIVLEHAFEYTGIESGDAKIHGVYNTREIAEAKKRKLEQNTRHFKMNGALGYVSVLKKTIEGPGYGKKLFVGENLLIIRK